MSDKSRAVVAHMLSSVAAITAADASAEALLNQTSQHIRDTVANVDSSNQDDVDSCLDQLESFADQLDQQATELASAVTANTPADPTSQGSIPPTSGASESGSGSSGTLDPHSVDGAAAAGGYNVTDGSAPSDPVAQTLPPAAGQHEDAPVEQPQNSTLSDAEGTSDASGNTGTGSDAGTNADTGASQGGSGDAGSAPADAATSSDGTSGDAAASEASAADNNEAA